MTLVSVPMFGLPIFSFKLGNRFTMYGGPVIGLGLGFGAALLLWRTGLASFVRVLCLLAIAGPLCSTSGTCPPNGRGRHGVRFSGNEGLRYWY